MAERPSDIRASHLDRGRVKGPIVCGATTKGVPARWARNFNTNNRIRRPDP